MRRVLMLLSIVVPGAAVAQGEWQSFRADGWQGARVCPFGEIAEGGYFCLELACPDGGPLGFRVRLTEDEVQPVVEALWTVNRREAGGIAMAPLEGAPGQYYAPYDAARDARLIERMRQGSEGSFTIVNRPIRAVRPFELRGSFGPITRALAECPLEMPLEEVAEARVPDDVIEVVPVAPLTDGADGVVAEARVPDDVIEVVPQGQVSDAVPDAVAGIVAEVPGPEIFGAPADPEAEAPPGASTAEDDPPEVALSLLPDLPGPDAAFAAATAPATDPDVPLVAEDGSVSDPPALVLQEIEAACVERGGGFVEVTDDFVRSADFDGDGIADMEVSYSGAVCDAAAGLYCDTASCLTRLYLGREDGRFVPAFEDVYMAARAASAFVVTYGAGSPACPEAEAPCEKVLIWRDGALVPVQP
jgi:hypothetical protein